MSTKEPGQVTYEKHVELSIRAGVDYMRFSDWQRVPAEAKADWAAVESAARDLERAAILKSLFGIIDQDTYAFILTGKHLEE